MRSNAIPAGIDWLSPPALLAAAYTVGFGFGVVDNLIGSANPSLIGDYRLRRLFYYDVSLSIWALIYLALGYALFVFGYRLRLAAGTAPTRGARNRAISPAMASAVTTIMFVATYGTLVAYTRTVGYGRFVALDESGASGLENLALLGELSILPFSLGMYRFAIWLRTNGELYMSLFDRVFTWVVMLPLQLWLSALIGSRSRTLAMLLVAVGAFHYGYRRLTVRWIFAVVAFCVLVVLPGISMLRAGAETPTLSPSLLWENLMERSSSLESFTAIFANLDLVPSPDPLWLTVAAGLVPRAVWPTKPMAATGSRFSEWASGGRSAGLSPSLPGEFLLHFDYVGGLVAMFVLGFAWRLIFVRWGPTGGGGNPRAFLYLALMPTFLSLDSGFVNPYSVLIRFLMVGVLMLVVCQKAPQVPAVESAVRRGGALRRSSLRPWLWQETKGR